MSAILVPRSDGSAVFMNTLDATENNRMGGDTWRGPSLIRAPLSAAVAAGGSCFSIPNPLGRTIIIGHCRIYITTAGGANTIDIGVAANGTTTSDILIDGQTLSAAGIFSNILAATAGTNGRPAQTWTATQFITGTPSATPTGLVGFFYAEILDP